MIVDAETGLNNDLSTLGDKLFYVIPGLRRSHHINMAAAGHPPDFIYFNFQMLQNENPHALLQTRGLAVYMNIQLKMLATNKYAGIGDSAI
jgi:hypothetical protein